jgi:DNA-binding transcriptional regulator YiaG
MNKPLTKSELSALASLAEATGLNNVQLAEKLDCDDQVLAYWLSGERKPRHPAMLKRALQLIVLEQRGVVTAKLIEQAMEVKK